MRCTPINVYEGGIHMHFICGMGGRMSTDFDFTGLVSLNPPTSEISNPRYYKLMKIIST